MNTINEQTATLTKLIAEIVELDSDKQCLSVELDYLIKHLQGYKRTCEECVAMDKCSNCGENPPTTEPKCFADWCERCDSSLYSTKDEHCECADCEKANPLCQDCRKRPKYDDGVCEKCYAVRLGCDSEEEEKKPEKPVRIFVGEWGKAPIVSDSNDSDWDGDLDDTPNCHQCGEDCGRSIIAHQKYKKTYFCSEECNREYDGEDE